MRTHKVFISIVFTVLFVSGCAIPSSTKHALSVESSTSPTASHMIDTWRLQTSAFPGLKKIGDLLYSNQPSSADLSTMTRIIATHNGSGSNIVTIHYEDLNLAKDFNSQLVVSNVLAFGISLPNISLMSTNPIPDPLNSLDHLSTGDLLNGLSIQQVLNFPGNFQNQINFLQSLLAARENLRNFLNLFTQFQSLQNTNFHSILVSQVRHMLEDQLTAIAQQTNGLNTNRVNYLDIHVSLDVLMAAYLKAYLDGTFVDRWGNQLSQPDLEKLGSESIAPFSQVAMEAVFDYAMMTPVIHDPNQSSTNKIPTFAVIFPQLYEETSTNLDAPGISPAENEAIKFCSNLSGEGAKHLSSFIVKSLGGASFGAKISVGDNSTFAEFTSTFFQECFRRNSEEAMYDFLECFQYRVDTNNDLGYATDFEANTNNLEGFSYLYCLDKPTQNAIVAALVSQDELKQLLQGGKWSETKTVAAVNLGANVINTDALQQIAQARTILNTNGDLSHDQQQALFKAISKLNLSQNSPATPAASGH